MCPLPDITTARRIGARHYGVEPRVEPLSAINHAVFRLRFADEVKILKLALDRDGAGVLKELMLIDRLEQQGVPVPRVEHRDPGAELVGRPYFVMDSAGEETVAQRILQPGEETGRLFVEMGAVLARIHGIEFAAGGRIYHDRIEPRDPRVARDRVHRDADWAASVGLIDAGEAERFKARPLPGIDGRALCHNDFHGHQCLVRDGRISAVVDWDQAWAGNSGIDLAIAHAYLDFYGRPKLTERFFSGYSAEGSLPDGYPRAYVPVRMAQALGMMRVWHDHGRHQHSRRSVELFRASATQLEG